MRRFGLFLLIVILCTLYGWPVRAQTTCEMDLRAAQAALTSAQTAAEQGDTAAARQFIAAAQAELEAILAACPPADAALTAMFEFADGLFRFNYPEAWVITNPISGFFILSPDAAAANSLIESNFAEALPAGGQVLLAVYGGADVLFDAEDFASFVSRMEETGLTSTTRLVNRQRVTINGLPGVRFDVDSDLYAGQAVILDVQPNDRIGLLLALTPRGEFGAFVAPFDAIVASVQAGAAPATTAPGAPPIISPNTGVALSDVTYGAAVNIRDVADDIGPGAAMLAPDGTRMAWFSPRDDGAICLYTFATAANACYPLPENFNSRAPYVLWSPDSRYIAFHQDGLVFFHEPDIWVFDAERATILNRTDDNINRWRFGTGETSPGDSAGPLWFDYALTWGTDNHIYFMRFEAPDATNFDAGTSGLYRLNPASGTAELVRDLTNDFGRFAIYQFQQEYHLHGTLAVSPDATQIALVVNDLGERDSPRNGVWIMPLNSAGPLRQVVEMRALVGGVSTAVREANGYLFPFGLAWTPDQTGLYIYGANPVFETMGARNLYHLNLGDGTLTPLVDLSGYTQRELYEVDETTGKTPLFAAARAAVMAPDGTTPLIFQLEPSSREAAVAAVALTEDGISMTTLAEFVYRGVPGQTAVAAASDGTLLMLGMLLQPER